jgi:hypothetical protein
MDPASPIYFSGEDVADLAVDAGSQFSAWSGEDARTSEQRRRVDGLAGLIHGFSFFFVFYSIYHGGHPTASEKVPLTVTFPPRCWLALLG